MALWIQQFDTEVLRWANAWVFWRPLADPFIIFRVEFLPWWVIVGLLAFGFATLPPLSTVFPSFRPLRRRNWEMVIVALIAGAIARFGVVGLIRAFYNRPRPFEVLPDLHQLLTHTPDGSFPSGHAAFFFAIAAVVGRYYPKTRVLFYATALSLSFSRVVTGLHWPSDIVGGAIIGIGAGFAAYWLTKKYR
jgi:undecaprenyl-diphosphatase